MDYYISMLCVKFCYEPKQFYYWLIFIHTNIYVITAIDYYWIWSHCYRCHCYWLYDDTVTVITDNDYTTDDTVTTTVITAIDYTTDEKVTATVITAILTNLYTVTTTAVTDTTTDDTVTDTVITVITANDCYWWWYIVIDYTTDDIVTTVITATN
jgi:hypothetical protein